MAKIIGHGAPTSKTFGVLGQEYFDKDSNKVYTCTKVTHKTAYRAGEADAEYEWSVIGGGSGGAASWNDLQDKPFGVKTEMVEIIPEQSVELADTNFGYSANDTFYVPELIEGNTYNVVWDDNEYKCIAKVDPTYGDIYIGNTGVAGGEPNTGEPFIISYTPTYSWIGAKTTGTHTLSITANLEVAIPIEDKFIPIVKNMYFALDQKYIFTEASCTIKVSKKELEDLIFGNHVVRFLTKRNDGYIVHTGYTYDPGTDVNYGNVLLSDNIGGTPGVWTLYTSEYTA